MSRFVFLIAFLAIAVSIILAFFGLLPPSPFESTVAEIIAFLHSESVRQGLSWLAWFFPVQNIVLWFPAIVNAVIAFYGAKMLFLVFKLHAS